MSLYEQFQTSSELETEGVWADYGLTKDGKPIRFRIARAGKTNKKYVRILNAALKPHRRALQTETMDDALANRLMMDCFIQGVLLGWENVTDREGKPMAFTKENAIKLFTDLPDLYDDLQGLSRNASLFREAINEADAGN